MTGGREIYDGGATDVPVDPGSNRGLKRIHVTVVAAYWQLKQRGPGPIK